MRRKVIKIDEERCDGCGLCVQACSEGAIRIVDGKARLVNEAYCDGLGNCVGECPRGAIVIEEREAIPFSAPDHAEDEGKEKRAGESQLVTKGGPAPTFPLTLCPGSEPLSLSRGEEEGWQEEGLSNWPIQLRLLPPHAPSLRGARLVVAADCTAFALPDFPRRILGNRVLVIACPKLDDTSGYTEKLAEMIKNGNIKEVTAVIMEVPCCFGLLKMLEEAVERAGNGAVLRCTVVSRRGKVLEENIIPGATPS